MLAVNPLDKALTMHLTRGISIIFMVQLDFEYSRSCKRWNSSVPISACLSFFSQKAPGVDYWNLPEFRTKTERGFLGIGRDKSVLVVFHDLVLAYVFLKLRHRGILPFS